MSRFWGAGTTDRSMVLSRMVAYSLGLVLVTNHFVPKVRRLIQPPLVHNIRLYLRCRCHSISRSHASSHCEAGAALKGLPPQPREINGILFIDGSGPRRICRGLAPCDVRGYQRRRMYAAAPIRPKANRISVPGSGTVLMPAPFNRATAGASRPAPSTLNPAGIVWL